MENEVGKGCYLEHMKVVGRVSLELGLSKEKFPIRVTRGGTMFSLLCYKYSRHNLYGEKLCVWFNIPGDEFVWYGRRHGDHSMVHCMRTKKKDVRKLRTKGAVWLNDEMETATSNMRR